MNCTKVLPAFVGHPMMSQSSVTPVDMAMRLSLCQSQPLCHLMGVTTLKSLYPHSQPRDIQAHRPSFRLTPRSSSSSSSSSLERTTTKSCMRREDGTPKKRRVVFADALGLSLTMVRLFIQEPTSPSVCPCSSPSVSPAAEPLSGLLVRTPPGPRHRLRLAFPQPNQDFKAFHSRLQETGVQLESCSVFETSLSGTVRVCNAGFDKTAHVRVTFDSWRSYKEVPCSSSVQRSAGLDADLFVFSVAVPQNLDPKERVEFCVSCRAGGGSTPLWDDNRGQNYRVIVEPEGSGNNQAFWSLSRPPSRTLKRPTLWSRMGTLGPKNSANPSLYASDVFSHQNWRTERTSQI
ncbi:protein phosphatase 1 regulatory subunit 3C [Osmerus eperlanus]|uniref:protein phosphatase 1 regulatory subunit 3C n=1 Tax=Osmerus eperlanus TaxID=29151 RepID=UPI002E0D77FF